MATMVADWPLKGIDLESFLSDMLIVCVYPSRDQHPIEEGEIVLNHSKRVVRHLKSSSWNRE